MFLPASDQVDEFKITNNHNHSFIQLVEVNVATFLKTEQRS